MSLAKSIHVLWLLELTIRTIVSRRRKIPIIKLNQDANKNVKNEMDHISVVETMFFKALWQEYWLRQQHRLEQ